MAHVMTAPQGVHKPLDWKASIWAGIIAGLVFLILEMLLVALIKGESPWGPPRMMAAMVLGQDVLPPPATFAMNIVLVAMMVHFILSIIYGFIVGWLVRDFNRLGNALLLGSLFGLTIYLINFYVIAPAMFPWFAMARNGISIFAHVVFGAVAAGAYVKLRRKVELAG